MTWRIFLQIFGLWSCVVSAAAPAKTRNSAAAPFAAPGWQVFTSGGSNAGQLGSFDSNSMWESPISVESGAFPPFDTFLGLDCSWQSTVLWTRSGRIVVFGVGEKTPTEFIQSVGKYDRLREVCASPVCRSDDPTHQVSLGLQHSILATKSGRVLGTGFAHFGCLGFVPPRITTGEPWTELTAVMNHIRAATAATDRVEAIGAGDYMSIFATLHGFVFGVGRSIEIDGSPEILLAQAETVAEGVRISELHPEWRSWLLEDGNESWRPQLTPLQALSPLYDSHGFDIGVGNQPMRAPEGWAKFVYTERANLGITKAGRVFSWGGSAFPLCRELPDDSAARFRAASLIGEVRLPHQHQVRSLYIPIEQFHLAANTTTLPANLTAWRYPDTVGQEGGYPDVMVWVGRAAVVLPRNVSVYAFNGSHVVALMPPADPVVQLVSVNKGGVLMRSEGGVFMGCEPPEPDRLRYMHGKGGGKLAVEVYDVPDSVDQAGGGGSSSSPGGVASWRGRIKSVQMMLGADVLLDTNGQVWTRGLQNANLLGRPVTDRFHPHVFERVPLPFAPGEAAEVIGAGPDFAVVVTNHNRVLSWGRSAESQRGSPFTAQFQQRVRMPRPTAIHNQTAFTQRCTPRHHWLTVPPDAGSTRPRIPWTSDPADWRPHVDPAPARLVGPVAGDNATDVYACPVVSGRAENGSADLPELVISMLALPLSSMLVTTHRTLVWGLSSTYQLGAIAEPPVSIDLPDTTELQGVLNANESIVHVNSEDSFTAALTSAGRVFTFGRTIDDQVCRGRNPDRSADLIWYVTPGTVDTPTVHPVYGEVAFMSVGISHMMMVTSRNILLTCGGNATSGDDPHAKERAILIGREHRWPGYTPHYIAAPVSTWPPEDWDPEDQVLQVSASARMSRILTTKGRLYTWGLFAPSLNRPGPLNQPLRANLDELTAADPTDRVKMVCGSGESTWLVTVGGRVMVSGHQLGSQYDRFMFLNDETVAQHHIVSCAMAFWSRLLLTSEGLVLGEGMNSYLQLGDNGPRSFNTPWQVTNLLDYTRWRGAMISSGVIHAIVVAYPRPEVYSLCDASMAPPVLPNGQRVVRLGESVPPTLAAAGGMVACLSTSHDGVISDVLCQWRTPKLEPVEPVLGYMNRTSGLTYCPVRLEHPIMFGTHGLEVAYDVMRDGWSTLQPLYSDGGAFTGGISQVNVSIVTCPAGRTPEPATSSCLQCPLHTYKTPSDTACQPCPPGTCFAAELVSGNRPDAVSIDFCTCCGAADFIPRPTATSPQDCDCHDITLNTPYGSGEASAVSCWTDPAHSTCTPDLRNSDYPALRTVQSVCRPCRIGEYRTISPVTGRAVCTLCTPAVVDQPGCLRCDDNHFAPQQANTMCLDCPAGSRSVRGASTCERCPLGTFREVEETLCEECPIGEVCRKANAVHDVTGEIFEVTVRETNLCQSDGVICASPGLSEPEPCPPGALCGGGRIAVCPAGKVCDGDVGQTTGVVCNMGMFKLPGPGGCHACAGAGTVGEGIQCTSDAILVSEGYFGSAEALWWRQVGILAGLAAAGGQTSQDTITNFVQLACERLLQYDPRVMTSDGRCPSVTAGRFEAWRCQYPKVCPAQRWEYPAVDTAVTSNSTVAGVWVQGLEAAAAPGATYPVWSRCLEGYEGAGCVYCQQGTGRHQSLCIACPSLGVAVFLWVLGLMGRMCILAVAARAIIPTVRCTMTSTTAQPAADTGIETGASIGTNRGAQDPVGAHLDSHVMPDSQVAMAAWVTLGLVLFVLRRAVVLLPSTVEWLVQALIAATLSPLATPLLSCSISTKNSGVGAPAILGLVGQWMLEVLLLRLLTSMGRSDRRAGSKGSFGTAPTVRALWLGTVRCSASLWGYGLPLLLLSVQATRTMLVPVAWPVAGSQAISTDSINRTTLYGTQQLEMEPDAAPGSLSQVLGATVCCVGIGLWATWLVVVMVRAGRILRADKFTTSFVRWHRFRDVLRGHRQMGVGLWWLCVHLTCGSVLWATSIGTLQTQFFTALITAATVWYVTTAAGGGQGVIRSSSKSTAVRVEDGSISKVALGGTALVSLGAAGGQLLWAEQEGGGASGQLADGIAYLTSAMAIVGLLTIVAGTVLAIVRSLRRS